MEKLNGIMNDFMKVEYGMISLSTVLRTLEEAYDLADKKELRENVLVIRRQIDSLQEELSTYIVKLDTYIFKK